MKLETQLSDRLLRFDGISAFEPERLAAAILKGAKPQQLRAIRSSQELEQFNAEMPPDEMIRLLEPEPITLSFEWKLPQAYLDLDLTDHLLKCFSEREAELTACYTASQLDAAGERLLLELELVRKHGLIELFKTIIFVLDEFKRTKQVWGVGRGSSCASYLLFLLGLHLVDPIIYDIPPEEFYK